MDPAMDRLGNRRCWARRPQPQCSMRPPPVVMGGVHSKHLAQVSLAEDQHPVGDLGPDRQDYACREAVRAADNRTVGDPRAGSGPTSATADVERLVLRTAEAVTAQVLLAQAAKAT